MTFLYALSLLAALAVGFFFGFWRGESVNGRKAIDYWLTASDNRVNWSRVTAAVGLASFTALQSAFLCVYVKRSGEGLTEALLIMASAALALAGINLGQYIVSKKPTVVGESSSTTTTTTDTARTSSAQTGVKS